MLSSCVLELSAGTQSVGKVAAEMGWEVVSIDNKSVKRFVKRLPEPTIVCDIMEWDYTCFQPGHFSVVWASPPCTAFSQLKHFNSTRKPRDEQIQDIKEQGLPLLDKTIEIIQYFQPKKYFLENPATGKMKMFLKGPFTDVSYHAYGYDYKKPTRIWHNLVTFEPKVNIEKPTAFIGVSSKPAPSDDSKAAWGSIHRTS